MTLHAPVSGPFAPNSVWRQGERPSQNPWIRSSDINNVVGQRAIVTMLGVDRKRHVVTTIGAVVAAIAAPGAPFITTLVLTFGTRVQFRWHLSVETIAGAKDAFALPSVTLVAEPGETVTIEILDVTTPSVSHQSIFAAGFTEITD